MTIAIQQLRSEFTNKNEATPFFLKVILAAAEIEVLRLREHEYLKDGNQARAAQCASEISQLKDSPEYKWFHKDHFLAFCEIEATAKKIFERSWDWSKVKQAVKALAA